MTGSLPLRVTTHVVDVGGKGFGPDGRQIYEEGINIPIMRLAEKGMFVEPVLAIIRNNVRNPIEVEGDLYSLRPAMMSAARV